MLLKTLKAALLASLFAFGASAATIETLPFGPVPDSLVFNLDSFDTTTGTLTNVQINLDVEFEGEVEISNNGAAGQLFESTVSLSFDLTNPAPTPSLMVVASDTFGPSAFAAGETQVFNVAGMGSNSLSSNNPAILAAFETVGPGSIMFPLDVVDIFTIVTNLDPFSSSSNISGEATVEVIYTSDANPVVPEPMSLYLMSGGLLGLGLLRVRRKK